MTEAELTKRLEKLERDNRRLKRGGLALLAMLVTLTTIYATRPVPDVIKAHEFDVVDTAGKTLATLDAKGGYGYVLLKSAHSGQVAEISTGFQAIYANPSHLGATEAGIGLSDNAGALVFSAMASRTGGRIFLTGDEPQIAVADTKGFKTTIGSKRLLNPTTGETYRTSADSIVIFGNGKKQRVIWKAP